MTDEFTQANKAGDFEKVASLIDQQPALANARTSQGLPAHGAEIQARNQDGITPLAIARQQGHDQMVAYLTNMGADT